MKNWPFTIILLSFAQLFLLGCSSNPSEQSTTSQSEPVVPGTYYTALVFETGESKLSDINQRYLNNLAQKANRDGREIKEIKILAWADKEYPEGKNKPEARDAILAKERAQKIKKYLEDDLHAEENISAFNMAKKPNLVSKLFKNDDWTVKEAFEKSGTTASRLPDGTISYTKASKALVIIDYE